MNNKYQIQEFAKELQTRLDYEAREASNIEYTPKLTRFRSDSPRTPINTNKSPGDEERDARGRPSEEEDDAGKERDCETPVFEW